MLTTLKLNYRSPKFYAKSGVYLRLNNKQYRLINLNWLRLFI